MRNLLKVLLLGIQIPVASQITNQLPHLFANGLSGVASKAVDYKAVMATKYIRTRSTPEPMREDYMGPRSNVVTSIADTKLNETISDKQMNPNLDLPFDSQSLIPGETIAAVFDLLKSPPPFEQATINVPTTMTVLLTSPNAYLGKMSPLHGEVRWLQRDGFLHVELVSTSNGYVVIHWPVRKLGIPQNAKLILHMNCPVIAVLYLWSDFTCYGSDITKFLLHQFTSWQHSARHLIISRSGYREFLFPTNLKDAIHYQQVGPILEPYLKQAVPQLLRKLKDEEYHR